CANALKQIGTALHNYHDSYGQLPPALDPNTPYNNPPNYQYYWSWMARILPFVEQDNLYKQADDWAHVGDQWQVWGGANGKNPSPNPALGVPQYVYQCPADNRVLVASYVPGQPGQPPTLTLAFTTFLGVSGIDYKTKDGLFFPKSRVRFADITDGLSNTLMVGERPPSKDLVFGWWFAGAGQPDKLTSTGSSDVVLGVNEINLLKNVY